jgi:Arc/MetJ family transcription regulator
VSPPLILSVGIQHPRKGHDVLLKALARLTDLDWTAVIVGKPYDPEHAAELARLHSELGLGRRVRLAGYVPDAELAELYAAASIFALATRYEGYGLVFRRGTGPRPAHRQLSHRRCSRHGARGRRSARRHRRRADAALTAGNRLPGWADTAGTVGKVLDRL